MQPTVVSRRFSTKGLPEAKQVTLWQEQFGRNMLRLDMSLTGPVVPRALRRRAEGRTRRGAARDGPVESARHAARGKFNRTF